MKSKRAREPKTREERDIRAEEAMRVTVQFFILALMKRQGVTVGRLARKCKMDTKKLKRNLTFEGDLTVRDLGRILFELGIPRPHDIVVEGFAVVWPLKSQKGSKGAPA